jgi:sortase A
MSRKIDALRKALIIIGASLLVGAILLLVAWQWNIHTSEQKAKEYVNAIRELIPEPQGAVPEERRDNTMASLSIEGEDFVGILEIPRFNSGLPIGASWGSPSKYPCRLRGSVYDRTIQIGGTSQKGQYDFYRDLCVGDSVFFTDMDGNLFSYRMVSMEVLKDTAVKDMYSGGYDLTLFTCTYSGESRVTIRCERNPI